MGRGSKYLSQMIPHHQMGVHMASMLSHHGSDPEIRTLAESIAEEQTTEIQQMQRWSDRWY
ncbi:MAG: DUF305 domain-containing protein [Chroococcales cyanobacterium]